MEYLLSVAAERDLLAIYDAGHALFGVDQAELYFTSLAEAMAFLAEFPRAARERTEIDPPIRAYRCKAHLILYLIEGDEILVLRVRHGREDWSSDPS